MFTTLHSIMNLTNHFLNNMIILVSFKDICMDVVLQTKVMNTGVLGKNVDPK